MRIGQASRFEPVGIESANSGVLTAFGLGGCLPLRPLFFAACPPTALSSDRRTWCGHSLREDDVDLAPRTL